MVATERVTSIAQGSKTDTDMSINISKTKEMHVEAPDAVTATTRDEATWMKRKAYANSDANMLAAHVYLPTNTGNANANGEACTTMTRFISTKFWQCVTTLDHQGDDF